MTDREKLIELLKAADRYEFEETRNSGVYDREAAWGYIADYLLANGVTFQKWIPATERFPETGVEVYVCDTYGDCFLSWMKDGYGGHSYWYYTECGEITHWMPLPEPPKEENK